MEDNQLDLRDAAVSRVADNAAADTGLACLTLLARFYGIAADSAQLKHEFSPAGTPFGESEILRAANSLGLKAGAHATSWDRLPELALPALAVFRDGRFVLLAKAEADKALIQDPAERSPRILDRESFEAVWTDRLILFTKRAGLRPEDRRFDFTWFIPAIVKHRKLLGEVLLASFFLQLFALLTPLFFQVVIDKVLVHKGLTTLHVLAVGMLALTLFEVVLGGLRTWLFAHTSSRIDVGLGAQLFRHLLRLPMAYFEARRVGDTVARVRELETVRQFLTGSTLTVVIDLFFTIVFIAVMFFYSVSLTLVVLATLPVYVLLSVAVTPILRARLNEKFNRGAENQAFLVEAVNGIATVKAMAVEPQLQQRWDEQLAAYVRAGLRATNLGNVAGQVAGFVNKLTTVLILWVGAHLVMTGKLTIGQLIAFNMLAGRVSGPVLRLVQLWQEFQQAGISVARLGDLLNTRPEATRESGSAGLPAIAGAISFDRVSFRYAPDARDVLRSVSIEIAAGSVIGIVGRSGSGKSTIAKLIQRMYVPQSGCVRVDGVDLAQLDPAWLRRRIGVVPQESMLFHRTVAENIALAEPGAPIERAIAAAQFAGAHEFILELPRGYDTVVGEHGCTLSGGQRQRIAIARALLTDPRILILDEATSALDYESERIIQTNLARIAQGRTVIIIAHRLSTVRTADRIIVLDDGEILEAGRHADLMAGNGYYARMHRYQEGHYAVA